MSSSKEVSARSPVHRLPSLKLLRLESGHIELEYGATTLIDRHLDPHLLRVGKTFDEGREGGDEGVLGAIVRWRIALVTQDLPIVELDTDAAVPVGVT